MHAALTYGLSGKIDMSPLQQFEFAWFISFLPRIFDSLTLQDAEGDSHTSHLHIHDFDVMCSDFEYYMAGSKAGRCVFLELDVVMA